MIQRNLTEILGFHAVRSNVLIDSIVQAKAGLSLASARIMAINSQPTSINKLRRAQLLLRQDGGEHSIQLQLAGRFLQEAIANKWQVGDLLDLSVARAGLIPNQYRKSNHGTRDLQLELSEDTSTVRLTRGDWRKLTFVKVKDLQKNGLSMQNKTVHLKGRFQWAGAEETVGNGKRTFTLRK